MRCALPEPETSDYATLIRPTILAGRPWTGRSPGRMSRAEARRGRRRAASKLAPKRLKTAINTGNPNGRVQATCPRDRWTTSRYGLPGGAGARRPAWRPAFGLGGDSAALQVGFAEVATRPCAQPGRRSPDRRELHCEAGFRRVNHQSGLSSALAFVRDEVPVTPELRVNGQVRRRRTARASSDPRPAAAATRPKRSTPRRSPGSPPR